MDINFSNTDVIFIYVEFQKKIRQLKEMKQLKGCPFSASDLDKEIKLYQTILDKLKDAAHGLEKLDD